ncbi:SMI1/KNR4 family protein [Thermoactinomyces daqus]|uniref:SMI1/KNR4 family protein n=1 Tax=Thermoactinomyces daqus TaxID=1329516 RepID=A0A7W2AJP7_9BACL|nr:SMI1/KNR4 family protein [Thermoactinomyces daqus]MBA4544093.1 SMI1/KNR4 family protein [Thermoactinomyces daqus]
MGADQTIKTLWNELQKLLSQKVKGYMGFQNKPATVEEIRQFEEKMKLSLPSDLKEWYLCNNGEDLDYGISIMGFPFLSINEMYEQWKVWDDLREEWNEEEGYTSYPDGHIKKMYINRGWIPFSHDGVGNHIGIDLDPDTKGTYGQIINFGRDEENKFVIAPSLKEFLQLLIDFYKKPESLFVKERGNRITPQFSNQGIHPIDFLRSKITPY